jgi:acetylornithine/succinyldiaminopimelate/putrescine aminotransferase
MAQDMVPFRTVQASLADVVGASYVGAVCEARAALSGEDVQALRRRTHQPLDWYPPAWHERLLTQLPRVGQQICAGTTDTAVGATTQACAAAEHRSAAPLTGYGFYRVGEDGRLFLTTKSEHYHAPLGHAFPGYALLETARSLGLPQATHNNTRGHVTRLLEETLVRAAEVDGLDRVLNLETGSLAVEAGVKMMLARFIAPESGGPKPLYKDRCPVFLVMGNDDGGLSANYHGTTVLTQMMRGMWPELLMMMEIEGQIKVIPIRPDSKEDLDAAFARHEAGGIYKTGLWAPGLFLFREYGLRPSMVALGKGFPGGEYPASRLICSAEMDTLPQFGALVTNGQEEIASLAYLITLRWAQENTEVIREIGDLYESRMREVTAKYPAIIAGISGQRHLLGLEFHDIATARACTEALNRAGLDVSAHTYKTECPPVALTKLPLTACPVVVEFVVQRLTDTLDRLGPSKN